MLNIWVIYLCYDNQPGENQYGPERKLRSPAWQMPHPAFGEISFPIAAELYLRQKEITKLQDKYDRKFKTNTTISVDIVKRLTP